MHALPLLLAVLTAASSALAAEPEVSFSCDNDGNLLSFAYDQQPVFDAALGQLSCPAADQVAEACRSGAEPQRNLEGVQKVFEFLADDPEIRGALTAGKSADSLVSSSLARVKALCARRGTEGGSTFEYSYPHGGFTARNIGAGGKNTMVKEQFRRVAELAVAGGVDPFLAMSVLVTEQTPLAANQRATESYFLGYGVFPVDARPAYSFLKCSVEKSDYSDFMRSPAGAVIKKHQALLDQIRSSGDSEGGTLNDQFGKIMHQLESLRAGGRNPEQAAKLDKELGELNKKYQKVYDAAIAKLPKGLSAYENQVAEQYATCWRSCFGINVGQCRKEPCNGNEAPVFDFGGDLPGAETRSFCSNSIALNHGNGPDFNATNAAGSTGACCFQIKAPPGSPAFKDKAHTMGAMGLRTFWDDKMLRALKIVGKKGGGDTLGGDDAHKLSRVAQMWNGWGRLNVTEKINTCMGSINLAEKPVTGAKVMDLLVNSTLPNAYLAEAVMAAAQKYKKPVKSLLCLYGGAGKKKMPAKAFHQQLNSRYLSGTGCK